MTWVFKLFVLTLLAGLLGTGCSARKDDAVADRLDRLKAELAEYIEGKDARIGVAVIYDGTDTVSVNGGRDFPMLSVYKFPQALAVEAGSAAVRVARIFGRAERQQCL